MKLRLMGFNVRGFDDPNGHTVEERTPRVHALIEEYDPDIIGFQEITRIWLKPLQGLDDRFDHVMMFRDCFDLEGAPIYWRKDRYEYVSSEQFWFNDQPDRPNIKGWGANHVRHCIRVTLRHLETGKTVHVMNCHVDYKPEPQVPSAELLVKKAKEFGDETVLCVADFNFTPVSPAYAKMTEYFNDTRGTFCPENKQATCVGYQIVGENINSIIDMSFYHGSAIKPVGYDVIIREFGEGLFASDHYPVIYDYEIE
ncbi:MAG: endonuclease/exonuclease/phosphatase family protein [Clostridia bacterium]|nr:endonuclease/exonuclease/phosphatase family protein [Clostridia bacterium]